MDAITVPSEDMPATLKVYVRASTVAKPDAVRVPPFAVPATVMSSTIKFSTSSSNVTLNGTVSSPVLLPVDELTETVGARVSIMTVTGADAVLELPARSVATSAAMDGITVPSVEPRATSNVVDVLPVHKNGVYCGNWGRCGVGVACKVCLSAAMDEITVPSVEPRATSKV